jgi:formate/nitrite transporter
MTELNIDALIPAEMAQRAEQIGVKKANSSALRLFALAVLAGAFISLGAMFATTALAGSNALPYGVARLLAGLTFSLGLILVIVGGAELFTGNTLIVMAWASGKVSLMALLRNWAIVYFGNFVGSVFTALMVFLSLHYTNGAGAIGATALSIANTKTGEAFIPALVSGILCNALVCLAVWLTFSARSTVDKISAIVFPITAFVAGGFEHSVANMYFIPMGLMIKTFDPAFVTKMSATVDNITLFNFFVSNLVPVTIGNIIGGGFLVGAAYWAIFLRNK